MFTEAVPGVPARTRVTPRAKAAMATEVLDKDRSVAAVAGDYRCGWHTVYDEVITVADEALQAEPAPVRVLGIDQTRRGKAKWETDAAAVIDWLAQREPGWSAQITHVAIDLSVVYARAVRLGLPRAIVIVDRFHLVKKANDMVDAVRRRVTLAQQAVAAAKPTSSGSTAVDCYAVLNGCPPSSEPPCSPRCSPPTPAKTSPRP